MSADHVALVMYESTKRRADFYQERYEAAEKVILALRLILKEADPALPNEYDGTGWMPIETAPLIGRD